VTRNARRGRGTNAYEVAARARDGSLRHVSNSVLVLEGPDDSFRVMHLLRDVHAAPGIPRHPTLAAAARDEDAPPIEPLTRRELEVLRMFAEAATVDEVAQALSISVFTARNHIASVQRKLGARSRLEMVLLGMRHGLV